MNEQLTFTHNAWKREKTLNNTINVELNYFPNCLHHIAYNDKKPTVPNSASLSEFITRKNHKLDAMNGCIHAIKGGLEKPSEIIIFSHDDVYLKDIDLFNTALALIFKDHDFIGRRIYGECGNLTNPYIMLESFIIKKSLLKILVSNIPEVHSIEDLPKDLRGSPAPEIFFGNYILRYSKNPYFFEKDQNVMNIPDSLGYQHHIKPRGWIE
jgi:hypothetical protein